MSDVQDIILETPDLDGENAHLDSPFVAIYPIDTIRSSPHDTERVDYETQNGKRVGEIFRATFDAMLQIDIYVAAGDSIDATDLGWELDRALRPYDERNEAETLPDENGNPVDEITHFRAGDGERDDDLSYSPSVRRWRHESMMKFHDEVSTSRDTVEVVEVPHTTDLEQDGKMIKYTYS